MKLGYIQSKPDRRTFWLSTYTAREWHLPAPPLNRKWSPAVTVPWGMMLNDKIGDCVGAAAGHTIMGWTANAGSLFVPSDEAILQTYKDVGGYVPGDDSTDNGMEPLEFLKYWRKTGVDGRQIGAFIAMNPRRPAQVLYAVNEFLCGYIAVALPNAVKGRGIWDIPDGQPLTGEWRQWSWGGHMVDIIDYDEGGVWVVTWGELLYVTWRFFCAYCIEAYTCISQDQLNGQGKSPLGFDMEQLRLDLQSIPEQ